MRYLIILGLGMLLGLPARSQRVERWVANPRARYKTDESGSQYQRILLQLPDSVERYELAFAFGSKPKISFLIVHTAPRPMSDSAAGTQPLEAEQAELIELGEIVIAGRRRYQQVRVNFKFVPEAGGLMKEYESIDYGLTSIPRSVSAKTQTTADAENSVLASGTWYKLAITEDGMYKLDASFLQQLGINTATLDPRQLRIFGGATGLLPQSNAAPRPADLPENAVIVVGEGDGQFGSSDYVLFCGQGPDAWRYGTSSARFYKEQHLFSDTTYYYLTVGPGQGKRVQAAATASSGATAATLYTLHSQESERENLIASGRQWFGERFETSPTQSFTLSVPASTQATGSSLRVQVAARSSVSSSFAISVGGANLGSIGLNGVLTSSTIADYASQAKTTFGALPAPSGGAYTVALAYNRAGNGTGWLDYLELEAAHTALQPNGFTQAWLKPTGGTFTAAFAGLSGYQLWDITEPRDARSITLAGSSISFDVVADTVRRWALFRDSDVKTPIARGTTPNQNLHGLGQAEYLLVSAPSLRPAADRLADFHRTHYSRTVHVVTTEQVYNEYSSGARDATAIRDFARQFYLRAEGNPESAPKYLLLLGDGSYDNRGVVGERGLVPTYQSRQSLRRTNTYVSDDYYGFLDENEGFWGEAAFVYEGDNRIDLNLLDIGVGRLPVRNLAEANAVVDKIIAYATGPTGSGAWQTKVLLLGDYKDGEGSLHMSQADSLARTIAPTNACLELDKLYIDQYPVDNLGSVLLFPEARAELLRKLDQGSLIVNYTGHGSETNLSNSGLVSTSDIEVLKNGTRQPFWITATCEFGRYDDPLRTTGAEALVLKPDGGAIGALTSVRLVYSQPNFQFNQSWHQYSLGFDDDLGRYRTLGEVMVRSKNQTYPSAPINTRNFSLLADPGLMLALPAPQVAITAINEQPVDAVADTLKALQRITLTGEVRNTAGDRLEGFDGTLSLVLYDKAQTLTTRLAAFDYKDYRSVLFSGAATVADGQFSLEFVLPLDINYSIGPGNLQLFAAGSDGDAAYGCWQQAIVCCTDPLAETDEAPPTVEVYLGDTNWVAGSTAGPEPLLLVRVADNTGINTSGLGIGRELTAVLDAETDNPIILNDAYQAAQDDPTRGEIRYPLSAIPAGSHTLTVKVWDVANNSGTGQTTFRIGDDPAELLASIVSYPNPFVPSQGQLRVRLNLGSPTDMLEMTATLLGPAGETVFQYRSAISEAGYVATPFAWDGKRSDGAPVASGIYTLLLEVRNPITGQQDSESEKIVIIQR